jgi:hypothetical protein
MTREVNTFILAVNSINLLYLIGAENITTDTKNDDKCHCGGSDGYTFFPGNDDNLPFSKMIEFSVTTDYDYDSLFFFLMTEFSSTPD